MEAVEGWQAVPQPDEVVRALLSKDRRMILYLLDQLGPIQQHKLQLLLRKINGKKYPDTVLLYHLKKLERAGLVGFKKDRELSTRIKIIYRAADFDIRLRSKGDLTVLLKPRPAPEKISIPTSEISLENIRLKTSIPLSSAA